MKRGSVLVVLVLVSILSACGGRVEQDSASGTTRKLTVSPAENPSLMVGDAATITESGNMLTVHSYAASVAPMESLKPEEGFEFSSIEAEGCASLSSGEDAMAITPNAFTLKLADGTVVLPETVEGRYMAAREPALQTMDPEPGTCSRGFITYQTPQGEKPEIVTFEDTLVAETAAVSWRIPAKP